VIELRRHAPVGRTRRALALDQPRGLPHLYAARKRRPLPDLFVADRAEARRGGRFRWFFSTCLAATVGAVAIAAVMLGSIDSREGPGRPLPPLVQRDDSRTPQLPAKSAEGLKWTTPKADRLQTITGAAATRFDIQDTRKETRLNREYLQKRPYARIVLRLAAVTPDPAIELPAFNPQTLYGLNLDNEKDAKGGATPPGGEITFRVVELLGSILPTEDGQELNGQDAAALLKRTDETTPLSEPGIRPTFVPEGAKLSLPKTDGRGRRAPENATNTTVFEKTTYESEEAALQDGDVSLASSLYASLFYGSHAQSITPQTLMRVLKAHAHDVDFRRRTRATDLAVFFFELNDEKGIDSPPGELLFTGLTIGGQAQKLYRFRSSDGSTEFYDENGANARRFLMRQPIQSDEARLTSGFGMRFHPLLNQRKMHTGVDWSASTGTPILAAGNGVIEEAQYKAQNGNFIRIRHANGYQTTYSHMSRYAIGIRDGIRVRQGQVIGFVGNTGLSTGPHLHYEVIVEERYVDPVKLPNVETRKLSGKQLADFHRERTRIDHLMTLPPVRVTNDGRH
jgi:murein DD-endopeptidase MepM/ murein hydrolase activator NlpD